MSNSASHPAVRDHCLAPGRAAGGPASGGRYRRLFETLAPLEAEEASLHGLGVVGGPCDGQAAPCVELLVGANLAGTKNTPSQAAVFGEGFPKAVEIRSHQQPEPAILQFFDCAFDRAVVMTAASQIQDIAGLPGGSVILGNVRLRYVAR